MADHTACQTTEDIILILLVKLSMKEKTDACRFCRLPDAFVLSEIDKLNLAFLLVNEI